MQFEESKTASHPDIDLLVNQERALVTLASQKITLASNTFIACSTVFLLWGKINITFLLSWLIVICALNLVRLVLSYEFRHNNWHEHYPNTILRVLWIGALASSSVWSVLVAVAGIDGYADTMALGFVVCGITAGAVIQGGAHKAAVWAFLLPIETTHFLVTVLYSTLDYFVLGSNILLYAGMMMTRAANSERSFITASRLKHEATELARSLRDANQTSTAVASRLDFIANHDPLTGLANRLAFKQAFAHALGLARAAGGEATLMLIDLDRFKAVNDTFGHAAGDAVLIETARRLKEILPAQDVIARLGGDEFAILVYRDTMDDIDLQIAESVLQELREPVFVGERYVQVGASLGLSNFPRDGFTAEELQICADVALYAAKSDGRRTYRAFDERLKAATHARRVFELDLAEALEAGRIEVWFQPQIQYSSFRVSGLETLVRWNHPNHGWVPPPEIVAAASATRQSPALTRYILRAACQMIQMLDSIDRQDIMVAVNISPQELGRYSVADMVAHELANHGIAASRLEMEITEESMYSEERGGEDIRKLHDMGVRISVDDFGVGYSSFGSLRNRRFDCIKIDKSFIDGISESPGDRAITQAILAVARALGVRSIAEGVETAEQVAVLGSLGCQTLQGYYFARPMPPRDLLRWLIAHEHELRMPSDPAVSQLMIAG